MAITFKKNNKTTKTQVQLATKILKNKNINIKIKKK